MGFYGPKKTHIKRIFGKRKKEDGTTEEVREVWADVERTDRLPTVEWPGAQGNTINLQWMDGPGEEGNPGRRMTNVKLTDPEDDSENPDTWIEIPTIDRMTMVRHPGAQEIVTTFKPSSADPVAEERETAREVAVRRIPFCETNVDDVLDATGYLADGEDYERKLNTLDEAQHLDVEIVESYPSKVYNGPSPQDVKVSLDNSALKDAYAKPPSDAKRPPLRLDPFQNIRNVCWGSGATEVEAASTLWRDLVLADSPRLSISMWVRTPAGLDNFVPLLQFGADNHTFPGGTTQKIEGNSYIFAGSGIVRFFFSSKKNYDIRDILTMGNFSGAPINYQVDDPFGWMWFQNSSDAWVDGVWNHIAISADTSSSLEHIVGVWPPDYFWYGSSRSKFDGAFVLNRASIDFDYMNQPIEIYGYAIQGTGQSYWDYPNFDLNFSGKFGLPVQPHNASATPSVVTNSVNIDFAAVQIWHDQFIDFRDPDVLAKFVAPAGDNPSADSVNGIRLVDPSVAQEAFGKPTFFFDGGPSKFAKNQGSGGNFTKIGDLKSFRPAPPKASSGTTT